MEPVDDINQIIVRKPSLLRPREKWALATVALPAQWQMTFGFREKSDVIFSMVTFALILTSKAHYSLFVILLVSPICIPAFASATKSLRRKSKLGNGVLTLSALGFQETRLSQRWIPWSACVKTLFQPHIANHMGPRDREVVFLRQPMIELDGSDLYDGSAPQTGGQAHVYIEFNAAWTMQEKIGLHELFCALIARANAGTPDDPQRKPLKKPKLWVDCILLAAAFLFPFTLGMVLHEKSNDAERAWLGALLFIAFPSIGCAIWLMGRHAERVLNFFHWLQDRWAPLRWPLVILMAILVVLNLGFRISR